MAPRRGDDLPKLATEPADRPSHDPHRDGGLTRQGLFGTTMAAAGVAMGLTSPLSFSRPPTHSLDRSRGRRGVAPGKGAVHESGLVLSSPDDLTFLSDSDNSGAGDLVFMTGQTERARLSASGELTITGLTTQASDILRVNATGSSSLRLRRDGTLLIDLDSTQGPNNPKALLLNYYYGGLGLVQDPRQPGTSDSVDIYHYQKGDGIFIRYAGGYLPGEPIQTGCSALNLLIPYYLDGDDTGRQGSIVNNLLHQKALYIETEPLNDAFSVHIRHWSHSPAIYIDAQNPANGVPQGGGGALTIDDWYTAPATVSITKHATPAKAVISLSERLGTDPGTPIPMIAFQRNDSKRTYYVNSDGSARFGYPGGSGLSPTIPFQIAFAAPGIQRTISIQNTNGTVNDGISVEFDDAVAQYGLIACQFTNVTPGSRESLMKFQIRSSNAMKTRLQLDSNGIAFFGTATAPKQTVTGSRGGNAALANLLSALDAYGLVTDATVQ
jgi:hypothetical protein